MKRICVLRTARVVPKPSPTARIGTLEGQRSINGISSIPRGHRVNDSSRVSYLALEDFTRVFKLLMLTKPNGLSLNASET